MEFQCFSGSLQQQLWYRDVSSNSSQRIRWQEVFGFPNHHWATWDLKDRFMLPLAENSRIKTAGKYLVVGCEKFHIKGVSYDPFAPNRRGEPFPELPPLRKDLALICSFGGNAIRVYFPPPQWFLDEAAQCGLRVLIDVP